MGSSHEDIRKMLRKRKREFISLVQMHQRKCGIPAGDNDQLVLPVSEFRTCLRAFGVVLSSKVSGSYFHGSGFESLHDEGTQKQRTTTGGRLEGPQWNEADRLRTQTQLPAACSFVPLAPRAPHSGRRRGR